MGSNPVSTLLDIAGGYCLHRCLHVIADLGVADCVDDQPVAPADLAARVGAHPDALARALRLLASRGVFECKGNAFGHTPASRLLRSDHPHSMRAVARMFGLPVMWDTCGSLDHTMRTGEPATQRRFPGGFWAYLAANPEAGAIFNAAMSGKAHGAVAGIIASYDFTRHQRIADIGGGRGHLLRAALDAAPAAHGVLFDLPNVVAQVAGTDRMTPQGGDFFKDALPGCDAYMLMEVIHDWGDDESVAILRAIRRAASDDARLLLIEQIVPEDPGPHWTKALDIHMLGLFGGRQRTRAEYTALLTRSGFKFLREIDTGAGVSILEAQAN